MRKSFAIALTVFATLFTAQFTAQVWAAVDVYEFSSEEHRERYQKFIEELRCPKCKNNNLAGTNSQIAVDLRRELHRMVEQGQSDEQITDFMVSRYGDFVLYRPRLQRSTLALWGGPILFVGVAALVVGSIVWRRRSASGGKRALSEAEQFELEQLLKSKKK